MVILYNYLLLLVFHYVSLFETNAANFLTLTRPNRSP